MRVVRTAWMGIAVVLALAPGRARAAERLPDILLVTVDTLRADRLSSYGYDRNTSPALDALLATGQRFANARTVEPLTAPAFASMLTSLDPHEHGLTRNGLAVRPDLPSFPRLLSRRGYETAAFLGNWTLREELAGFAEYFDTYKTILNRKRWFGLAKREAEAADVSEEALEWLRGHLETRPRRPWLLWVHYVEPHAPYRLHQEFLDQIGAQGGAFSVKNRYDTEIAAVDAEIASFLERARALDPEASPRLTVFLSDHGESLGQHGYWGHGRHLYEATLWVPMGISWPGEIQPGVIQAPAMITDLAPTLLGLLGLGSTDLFRGYDWSPVLTGGQPEPVGRVTYHQAHRASVEAKEDNTRLRRKGLLEVAKVAEGWKEMYRVGRGKRRLFDLAADREELDSQVAIQSQPSEELAAWLEEVRLGLRAADDLPPPTLTDEDIRALRALGYID